MELDGKVFELIFRLLLIYLNCNKKNVTLSHVMVCLWRSLDFFLVLEKYFFCLLSVATNYCWMFLFMPCTRWESKKCVPMGLMFFFWTLSPRNQNEKHNAQLERIIPCCVTNHCSSLNQFYFLLFLKIFCYIAIHFI